LSKDFKDFVLSVMKYRSLSLSKGRLGDWETMGFRFLSLSKGIVLSVMNYRSLSLSKGRLGD